MISTVARNGKMGFGGDGQSATTAQLASSSGVAVDASANLYIAETANGRMRKVSAGVNSLRELASPDCGRHGG